MKESPESVEAYLLQFPQEVQVKLRQLQAVLREELPDAEEVISYQMPTFRQTYNILHYAAYSKHIGFYPAPSGITGIDETRIAPYRHAKGTLHFALDKPLPVDLIRDIARLRLSEVETRIREKQTKSAVRRQTKKP